MNQIEHVSEGPFARGSTRRTKWVSLGRLYRREVQEELARYPAKPLGVVTEQDLAGLPSPVQRYFRACGFIGRPHAVNLQISWKSMQLKRSRDADWMQVDCQQFNSIPEPVRIVLMRAKLGGLVPFEGRDKYQDGHGNMQIRVGKLFTVGDVQGRSMDESALVTVLAEALLAPSYAVQPYIAWQPVDDRSAQARCTFGGVSVSGVFHFNEADELIRFDTEGRWQDGKPPRKLPWSAYLTDYQRRDGLAYPTGLRATWHEPDGDFTYAKGIIEAIEFNVQD